MPLVDDASPTVGRTEEHAKLLAALEDGRAGRARAVVLKGEAGIGKTRLINELVAEAHAADGTLPTVVTVTHCVDQGEIGDPFGPIRRTLRDICGAVGAETFRASAGGPVVCRTLAALVPDIDDAVDDEPPTVPAAEAIERLLETLSTRHHLVIVIEDIHWADAATRSLLRSLAQSLRGQHLTIVMTVRTDDVDRAHPLKDVLLTFERNRGITVLDVPRLGRDDVDELATRLTGRRPSQTSLDALMRRSEGVPFFVEELLDISGRTLPDSLREVSLARCDRLPAHARRLVDVLSVGGASVEHEVLEAVWPDDAASLASALQAAIDANVVLSSRTRYRFRHALTREAVYQDLLPHDRVRWHRSYADSLQLLVDSGESTHAAMTAEHWAAAGEPALAFEASVTARTHARRRLAPTAAARIGERLFRHWDDVDDAARVVGMSRLELAAEVSADYQADHNITACMDFMQTVLAQADPDDVERVPLLLHLLDIGREVGWASDTTDAVDEIFTLLEGHDDPASQALRARALGWRTCFMKGSERLETAAKAVELAESLGDREALCSTLFCEARAESAAGNETRGVELLERAAALSRPGDLYRFYIANNLACGLTFVGRFDDAITVGLGAFAEAEAEGRARAAAYVVSSTSEATMWAGRVEESIAQAQQSRRLSRDESTWVAVNSLWVESMNLIWSGRVDEARRLIASESNAEVVAEASTDAYAAGWSEVELALAACAAREAEGEERARILEDCVPLLSPLMDPAVLDEPGDWDILALSAARLLADLGLAGGDVDAALLERAERVSSMLHDGGWHRTARAMVAAFAVEARGDASAADAWRDVVARAQQGGCPVRLEHEGRLRLAQALLRDGSQGSRAEAAELLSTVASTAGDVGAGLIAQWAQSELDALDTEPSRRGGDELTLTERERDVMALVAKGMTNGQIGKELYISPKTVSVHVSAVLAKTGASNRAEAAVLVAPQLARSGSAAD